MPTAKESAAMAMISSRAKFASDMKEPKCVHWKGHIAAKRNCGHD